MSESDMPANDLGRYGGNPGWRVLVQSFDYGARTGVAVESKGRRLAVRIPSAVDPSAAIAMCIPTFSKWIAEQGLNHD